MQLELEEANSYSRRDCAIVSGNALPPGVVNEETSNVIANVLQEKLNLQISANDISTAHRLGPKPVGPGADGRKIIVKFVRRDIKRRVLKTAKQKRDSGIYINECLTPKKRSLFFTARKLNRLSPVIKGCSTFDGRVYLYTAGQGEGARDVRHHIDTSETLAKLCQQFLNKSLDAFLENWQR